MTIKTEVSTGRTSREDGSPDPKILASVKDIVALLAQTVSHMKLYPSHHSSVTHFRELLMDKLTAYFRDADELEIEIQQNSFLFEGETVYRDENVLRSLPYLFFKDGMKKLAFLQGLDSEELEAFLATVREISLLPVDVGDIVDALWQRDLVHVRYFAPDDFLESKVTVQQRIPSQFQIKPEELYAGRIDLRPVDVAEMFTRMRSATQPVAQDEVDYAARFAPLDEAEMGTLESTVEAQRRVAPDKDFLDLTLELLNIEERFEVFSGVLGFLKKFHTAQLQAHDFVHAAQMLGQIDQIGQAVEGKVPDKAKAIADFKAALEDAFPEKELLKAACEKKIFDAEGFFLYLSRVGPPAFALGAELVGHGPNEDFRRRAVRFLEDMGRRDPQALSKLAQDSQPEFTRIVIAVFAKIRDPRAIPLLGEIIGFKNKTNQLKAIQALGAFPDLPAQKILTGLLRDDDADIRTQAAEAVRLSGDPATVAELIQSASRKKFLMKSSAEKAAFLKAIGRSGSANAAAFLGTVALKPAIVEGRRRREARLAAVAGLEAHGGTEAIDVLRNAARRGPRRVKAASRIALARLKPAHGDGKQP
jgi:HEAT repeat protein